MKALTTLLAHIQAVLRSTLLSLVTWGLVVSECLSNPVDGGSPIASTALTLAREEKWFCYL